MLRPEALELAPSETPGTLPARVTATTFRGDHTSVEAVPLADPSIRLLLRSSQDLAVGVSVGLRIGDGWVLPQAAEPLSG